MALYVYEVFGTDVSETVEDRKCIELRSIVIPWNDVQDDYEPSVGLGCLVKYRRQADVTASGLTHSGFPSCYWGARFCSQLFQRRTVLVVSRE